MIALIEKVSNGVYLLVTVALMALAIAFVCFAVGLVITPALSGERVLPAMLNAVSLLVIALAISDVAKFLFEEQVVGDHDLRSAGEVRRTLSKFLTVIIIAASMEALVFMFDREGGDHHTRVLYGALLIAAVGALVVASAVHQRLTRSVEQSDPTDTPPQDPA